MEVFTMHRNKLLQNLLNYKETEELIQFDQIWRGLILLLSRPGG